MEEYRIDIKIRNNLILKKLNQAGYKTIGEFCRKNSLRGKEGNLGEILNMKISPLDSKGNFRKIIIKLCDIINCYPEELFTESQLHCAIKTNKTTLIANEAEMKFFLENTKEQLSIENKIYKDTLPEEMEKYLNTLTPREKEIILMRFFDDKTLEECSEIFDVNRERIRQIEAKALRKLRHPSISQKLINFLDV